MASLGHSCVVCGIQLPIEDGHDVCVRCLGEEHAAMAVNNPSSCMDCSILPKRSLEARLCVFGPKRGGGVTPPPVLQQTKRTRLEELGGSSSVDFYLKSPLRPGERSGVEGLEEDDCDDEVDVLGISDDGEIQCMAEEDEQTKESKRQQFRALVQRASQALGLGSVSGQIPPPSRFDDEEGFTEAEMPFGVPLLPEMEDLMQMAFQTPTAKLVFSATAR